MKHYIFLQLIGLLLCGAAHAQREQVWAFGDSAGVSFNNMPPLALKTKIHSNEACASVSEPGGQLLFYTDGNIVWDRSHLVMPNGASLINDVPFGPFGPTSSTAQGALIVPVPGQPFRYYIFSLTCIELGANRGRLYYSVVDMSLNGGMGDVVAAGKGTLLDSMNTEHMTGVVGDHCNIWVLTLSVSNANTEHIKAFEVNDAGVQTVPVVSTFSIPTTTGSNYGQMDVSPNRKMLTLSRAVPFSSFGGALELFAFDPATGQASDQRILDSAGRYSACFSPDNSKLYTNAVTTASIVQYDLNAGSLAAIISSRTNIGAAGGGAIRRGPDGKIYCGGNNALSVVQHPNLAGTASTLVTDALPLQPNTSLIFGLPNIVPELKRDTVYQSLASKAPCFSTSHTLHAADVTGWDYQWSHGPAGPSAAVSDPGTYWVSYHTPPCVFHTDTFRVNFDGQSPQLHALAGCRNDTNAMAWAVPAPGDTATYTYTWYNGSGSLIVRGSLMTNHGDTLQPIAEGQYRLKLETLSGCSTTINIVVPPPSPYRAAFQLSDTVICMGQNISFANTSSGDMRSWSWQFGDGLDAAVKDPTHTYPNHGVYSVQLIAGTDYPCFDTAFATVIVDSLLSGSFITSRDSACTGEAILFTPMIDSTALNLSWQFGEDRMFTGNEAVQHAFEQDGRQQVAVTFHFRACPDHSFTRQVSIYPLPKVDLGPDSTLCLDGNPLYLQPLGPTPGGPYQSRWNTGDTSASLKVVHPGRYSLTLSLPPLGCSTTESVVINKDCYIDIPNAFTPNGDGVNDYFFPRQLLSRRVTRFSMQLFNRWGQVVFETQNIHGRGWDGRFNDKDQPQGVYIYQVEAEIDGRRQERYQGNVTLIR
ncbi:T9SS type B sorting domain-containing protein [Taibaiella helva]|uniref:T9SS type B sorting domain-containing protein n=1 Tax=Taibaiella helva TaxID=2301235 RepID=UPI000E58A6C6|nr:gliding motility-associated C-terminal domain-containing protein [Taibaiella helva]